MDPNHVMAVFGMVFSVFVTTTVLHLVLPAKEVQGYACDFAGRRLSYRLNGVPVLFITVAGYIFICLSSDATLYFKLSDALSGSSAIKSGSHSGSSSVFALLCDIPVLWIVSSSIGLVASIALFIRGAILTSRPPPNTLLDDKFTRCITTDLLSAADLNNNTPKSPSEVKKLLSRHAQHPVSVVSRFGIGYEYNPRVSLLGREVDIKMHLYLLGAVLLELNIVSAAMNVLVSPGRDDAPVKAMLLYLGLFSWFVTEYLWFENVHLYTYDIFAERVGLKLAFGCLGFYPCFYAVGTIPFLWSDSGYQVTEMANTEMIFTAGVFFSGWILTRGANLQKHAAKRDPSATSCFGGLIPLEYLSTGGRNSGLLVSGFWGLARHLNYLGEIIQAIALSIPAGRGSWVPWLYPLYYIVLFVGRMIDDDQLCAAKYGKETWDGYKKLVPHWIIPYII